ncbi:hypothetical protein GGQ22_16495 [Nocardioides sp. zg-579]|uniref:Uncharacterized protein n=1 Tax=Nocardioides marmotae TaxID=2663857 RepID=A0A6I3JF07_9ACTN|nr:hypothetical protein [Nocardioides marmotae]MCR6033025.1 hypothetical protein [Gordonia jinghuaiqii]MTB96677.1 hypothetical protein [Nocardioides marmotae]QKE03108.1 hypothetical protein HPC71_20115 [Nocardioides marmotae]
MRRLAGLVLALTTTGVLMAGCGDPKVSPEEGAEGTAASRAEVEEAVREVADVARGAGLEVGRLTGGWSVCTPEPPSLEYDAGGGGDPGDLSPAAMVAKVTDALEAAGWKVENAGTDPRPYGVLTRGDLRASVGVSRRYPGQVTVGVVGPCVDTTNEQDDLLGETYDVPLD